METLEKALGKARLEANGRRTRLPLQPWPPSVHKDESPEFVERRDAMGTKPSDRRILYQPISERTLRENRLVAGLARDKLADTYRMLRAQVLQRLAARRARSLAVCSAVASEGKSLTAANLAISLAMDPNHRALLIDLDLRNPTVHKLFNLDVRKGIGDYLGGYGDLEECLVSPGIERLVLCPATGRCVNSSELLSSPRMAALVRELTSRYAEYILIYDLPPLLVSDDSLVALPHIDASLLVVREGKTRAGEIQRSLELLSGHSLLGTLLNNSAEHNPYPYY